MKQVKLKLMDIKSNPFKKFISGGKLNPEIIEKLEEGYKQTRFHENLCARKNASGGVELVYGHHRLQAAKNVYGVNHEITITVYDTNEFSDEQMLLDMIRENMAQRGEDYRDMADCIMLAKKWLGGDKKLLSGLTTSKQGKRTDLGEEHIGARQIAIFISNQGKTISHVQVEKYITIEEGLSSELKKKVEKGTRSGKVEEGNIGFEVASELAKFEKGEQKDLLEQIEKAKLNKDKIKQLLASYKEATEEVKAQVRKGTLDLTDVPIENMKEEVKKKMEQQKEMDKGKVIVTHYKKFLRDGGNYVGRTNGEIDTTCAYFDGLRQQGILQDLEWKEIYQILNEIPKAGKKYAKLGEELIGGI